MVKWLRYSVLLIILSSCTHPFKNAPCDNTPLGNIEALWKIIDEKYCFVEDKGIDWDAIGKEYKDSAAQIDIHNKNWTIELFDLMESMINQLHDGHVNIFTPFDVSNSTEWYKGYPDIYNEDIIKQYYLQGSRQAGGLQYNIIADGQIGYIYYSSFSSGFGTTNMYYVLSSFKDCRGIVLDVRHNGGGALTNAYKLASTFIDKDTLVGYWHHKSGKDRNDFSPLEPIYIRCSDMPNKWLRPVVVLQDRHTYSAANTFVNAMRYAPNALLLGGKSGGGGGMPMSYELPIGWTIRFSSVKMYDANKVSIEEGICPHVMDTLSNKDKDDLIEHAIQIINKAYE